MMMKTVVMQLSATSGSPKHDTGRPGGGAKRQVHMGMTIFLCLRAS